MKINPLQNREKKIAEYLNELKFERIKNKWDNSLDFFFHLRFSPSKNGLLMNSPQEIKLKSNPKDDNELKVFFSNQEKPIVHFVPIVHFEQEPKQNTMSFYKNLKYFFLISNSILIYNDTLDTKKKEFAELKTLKFYFIVQLEKNYCFTTLKIKKMRKIKLIYNENFKPSDVLLLKDLIKGIWIEALTYTGINLTHGTPKIEDVCSIEIMTLTIGCPEQGQEGINFSEFIVGLEVNSGKKTLNTELVSVEDFSLHSSPILTSSDNIPYLPEHLTFDDEYLNIHDSFLVGRIFNELWLTSNDVIKHWGSHVSKGKVIENFGSMVSNFLTGLMEEFNKLLPSHLHKKSKNFLKKTKELSDMVQGRIKSLFTSQLLILQTQALDKFKDILIWQAKFSHKGFEFEKGVAILQVNDWFEAKASRISNTELRLDINGARKELQQELGIFAEMFKDSAVSKLISIQKTAKKTSKGKLKQSGVVAGFGITAAVRPRGFGNLQLVTSYSHGPHVFNFSLVNDLDVAEQEGQIRIKPIRIQPSLNFDIDI